MTELDDFCGSYYLNEDKIYIKCSVLEMSKQIKEMIQNDTKHVALDRLNGKRIYTVWLGLDHSFDEDGEPLLFETMIFVGNDNSEIYMDRYSTWNAAEEGHKRAVQWVKDGCINDD